MVSAPRYWRLVRLDSTGNRRVEEIVPVKVFFQEQFAGVIDRTEGNDTAVQRRLMRLWQDETGEVADLAYRCLRCFVSNQIEQVCVDLERQFGSEHGFTRYDLFALVLDDDGQHRRAARTSTNTTATASLYQSLAEQILQSFDADRAGLNTWVSRMVKHHRELNIFLLEHGVYLVSDWAILNDTTPRQLERIFREFHRFSEAEIRQAARLLEAYHAVYRQDRLQQRQVGSRGGACQPPSREQLARIAQQLGSSVPGDRLLTQLQFIATRLRQYRVAVRGGSLPTQSLDQPEAGAIAATLPNPEGEDDDAETTALFLKAYRQQFQESLDGAVEQVLGDRLQKLKPPKNHHFLVALHLFHAEGKSMSEIAPRVGLKEQYQVTRLMKLKDLRADVRQCLLLQLRDRVRDLASRYADPTQLESLDQQVEAALEAQVDPLFQQAEAETSSSRNRPLESVFARSLCRYLDTQM